VSLYLLRFLLKALAEDKETVSECSSQGNLINTVLALSEKTKVDIKAPVNHLFNLYLIKENT